MGKGKKSKGGGKRAREGEEDQTSSSKFSKPSSVYDILGSDAASSVELKPEQVGFGLKMRDVQDLVHWVLGEGKSPSWCFVKNKILVKGVVLIALNCLDSSSYEENLDLFPVMSTMESCVASAPGSKNRVFPSLSVLLTTGVAEKGRQPQKKPSAKKMEPPSFYLLGADQLRENLYPMAPEGEGWVSFPSKDLEGKETMIALDCEMCYTSAGLEVTRITCVNEAMEVVYDKMVMPDNPIIDYNTRFSGITPEQMEGVTRTVRDAQRDLQEIISAETILVGHSLENDLQGLKIVHSRVIDTAVIYPHPRGQKFKNSLRFLSQRYLKRTIQEDTHDSVQDCVAVMELAQLKIARGPNFGEITEEDTESLFTRLESFGHHCSMVDIHKHVERYGNLGAVNCIPCSTDDEILSKTVKLVSGGSEGFICAQFHDLFNFYCRKGSDADEKKKVLRGLDARVSEIYNAAPPNTLMIVVGTSGDLFPVYRLEEVKAQARKQSVEAWTEKEEAELRDAVERARRGRSFFCVKR